MFLMTFRNFDPVVFSMTAPLFPVVGVSADPKAEKRQEQYNRKAAALQHSIRGAEKL
jgi:hypothetical protein